MIFDGKNAPSLAEAARQTRESREDWPPPELVKANERLKAKQKKNAEEHQKVIQPRLGKPSDAFLQQGKTEEKQGKAEKKKNGFGPLTNYGDGKHGINPLWLFQNILFDKEISPPEKIIKLIIASHLNCRTGQLNPRVELISEEANMNERTIYRQIAKLQKKKKLIVVGNKGRWANRYFLPETMPYLDELDDLNQDPNDYEIK